MSTHRTIISLLVALFAAVASAQPASYEVFVEEGVRPKLSPSAVAGIALSAHGAAAQSGASTAGRAGGPDAEAATVNRVECLRGTELRRAMLPASDPDAPVWIVRMRGRFVNFRTPPGTASQVRTSGFYVIDDETGEVVAFGGSGGGATPQP